MSALTLPGSIPGLLRRGSPLVEGPYQYTSVVISIADGVAKVAASDGAFVSRRNACDLALDLTDATGRAHAAWWLSEHGSPSLRPYPGADLTTIGWMHGSYGWVLAGSRGSHSGWAGRRWTGMHVGIMPTVHDWLADLDASDKAALPDGSRWVDAEALRLVVLHVAGVSP